MLAVGCGDSPSASPAPPPSTSLVRSITTLTEDGGRVAWSASLNRIAFDRAGSDGYFDIWTMNPDASAQACLTCGRPNFPTRHIGNPSWHPAGTYIAFQGQKEIATGNLLDFFANPGSGLNNDLYVMDAAAQQAWRLVTVPFGPGGILHPQFSRSGRELAWAERIANVGSFGQWVIRLADFRVVGGVPTLDNVRTYAPGAQRLFYETHGFGPGDGDIIFSGNLDPGLHEHGIDIYRFTLASGALSNLTSTPTEWDEHAHFSPAGNRIAWMSSRGFPPIAEPSQLRAEFWLMNADGSGKVQLTHFNQPGQPEFIAGQAIAADLDWSPDGRRVVGYVITNPSQVRGRIVLIDLNLPFSDGGRGCRPAAAANQRNRTLRRRLRMRSRGRHGRNAHAQRDRRGCGNNGVSRTARGDGSPRVTRRTDRPPAAWPQDVVSRGTSRRQDACRCSAGEAVAQFDGSRLVSVFGTLFPACDALTPGMDAAQAATIAARDVRLVGRDPLALVAMPQANGTCVPAYVGRGVSAVGPVTVLVDARAGAPIYENLAGGARLALDDTPLTTVAARTQVMGGRSYAHDDSRPPGIITLDLAGRIDRTAQSFRGFGLADIASDADGAWDDAAVHAFHASAAAAYDHLLSQFSRRGIAAHRPIVGMVHPRLAADIDSGNARGPFHAGDGMFFVPDSAVGLVAATPRSVMDALAHAIVDHTSGLAPAGEAGAVREAFAAMLRSGVSFEALQPPDSDESVPAHALSIARARLERTGGGSPHDIDRVFFRAVTELLPPRTTFAMARKAMLQSARDLFGAASAVEAAVRAGWTATDTPQP